MITFCLGFRRWHVEHLRRCLRSLARFGKPIIVVHDTRDAEGLEPLAALGLGGLRWRPLPMEEWSRSRALNKAFASVMTPYVCFTDADMIFPSHWLAVAEAHVDRDKVWLTDSRDLDERATAYLSGCVTPGDYGDEFLAHASELHDRIGQGAAMVVPAEWFRLVRGFDEQMQVWSSEDNDLVYRARLDGLQVEWLPNTFVAHQWHRRDWCTAEQFESVKRNRHILESRMRNRGPVVVNPDGWEGED